VVVGSIPTLGAPFVRQDLGTVNKTVLFDNFSKIQSFLFCNAKCRISVDECKIIAESSVFESKDSREKDRKQFLFRLTPFHNILQ
jgi:hypothetical protein